MAERGIAMIIVMIILLAMGVYFFDRFIDSEVDESLECRVDAECVPASCCHASSCVSAQKKPNCSGIYCTQECAPGTLDCGQGNCRCVKNKCETVFKWKNSF